MGINPFDTNRFEGQVFLELIKVCLIGVAASIVVFSFQEQVKQDQKLNQEALAVAKIRTDMLVEQRNRLISTMSDYFQLVDEIALIGKAKKRSLELRRTLHSVRVNLEVAGIAVGLTHGRQKTETAFAKAGDEFIGSLQSLNQTMIEGATDQRIKKQAQCLRADYGLLLDTLAQQTLDAVRQDFEDVYGG